MNTSTVLVPLLSALTGAVIGVLVHRLTLHREALAARRTQRIDFLLTAYRRLIRASSRDRLTPEHRDDLEAAFADIMLLGGHAEIEAARTFMVAFTEVGDADLNPVIKALRSSLRSEIGLEDLPLPKLYNLRIYLTGDKPAPRSRTG